MCKLIGISKMSVRTLKQASHLIKVSSEMLGASQKDGFGYALNSDTGNYVEKYVNPNDCAGLSVIKDSIDMMPLSLKTKIVEGVDFEVNGHRPKSGKAIGAYIAHGRTATCGKNIANTHPFSGFNKDGQVIIAHNGVVEWDGVSLPLSTTCDSEHLLNCFVHLDGEQSFKDGISGYAAITGINPAGELFVLRDNKAPLYVKYIKELDTYIVCTDKSHCDELCKLLINFNELKNPTVSTPMLLAEYVKHTFHKNGEITSVEFPKFDNKLSYTGTASIYRSLGSAGAVGYSDEWNSYNAYNPRKPYTPPTVSTPAPVVTPTVVTNTGTDKTTPSQFLSAKEQEEVEKHRQQMQQRQKNNSRKQMKPWKESDNA
jgi:hypothetical protein